MKWRILIADDHPLMLNAVADIFEPPEFEVVARCRDGLVARDTILALAPDVAILDINMPHLSGLDLLAEARSAGWTVRLVLLTATLDPEQILAALRLKVDGFVLKGVDGEVLLRAVRSVAQGAAWVDKEAMSQVIDLVAVDQDAKASPNLTPREGDVMRCVLNGRRNKEIARDLGISEGTVKMHLHNLYEKMDVSSRTELALLGRDLGIL